MYPHTLSMYFFPLSIYAVLAPNPYSDEVIGLPLKLLSKIRLRPPMTSELYEDIVRYPSRFILDASIVMLSFVRLIEDMILSFDTVSSGAGVQSVALFPVSTL